MAEWRVAVLCGRWSPSLYRFRAMSVKLRAASRPFASGLGGAVFVSRFAGNENGIFLPLLVAAANDHRAQTPTLLKNSCGVWGGFCKKRLEPQPKFAVPWGGPLLYRWRGTVSPCTVSMIGCPTGGITKDDCRSCPKSSIIQVGWSLLTASSSRERNPTLSIKRAPHSLLGPTAGHQKLTFSLPFRFSICRASADVATSRLRISARWTIFSTSSALLFASTPFLM